MAFDEELAERLRGCLGTQAGLMEKRMFGGLAFLIGGNLAVAASGQGGLMVRCDPAATESLIDPPLVERMVMRGRAMDGWLRVTVDADEARLRPWVDLGVAYAMSLPPK